MTQALPCVQFRLLRCISKGIPKHLIQYIGGGAFCIVSEIWVACSHAAEQERRFETKLKGSDDEDDDEDAGGDCGDEPHVC